MGTTRTFVKGILLTLVCVTYYHACGSAFMNQSEEDSLGGEKLPLERKCGLYMAESAIPNSGLGTYTAVDIPSGQTITSEIVINLSNYKAPNDIIDSYSWNHKRTRSQYEADVIESVVPGLGALVNCHPGLINTQISPPKINSAGLHRYSDPGVGAFSSFHDMAFSSSQHIQA
eukprot:7426904-Ditylum_brightwellii.AAC.1